MKDFWGLLAGLVDRSDASLSSLSFHGPRLVNLIPGAACKTTSMRSPRSLHRSGLGISVYTIGAVGEHVAAQIEAEDKHAFGQRRNLCVPFEDSAECPIPSRNGHALLCAFSTSDVPPHPLRALPARLPQPAATNSPVCRLRSPPTSMAFAKPLA